ncbi:hypothetical protein, partial [Caldifermentibacillus hisashii]|uniref:hypothetical protein n=1 Tax=Caldifermentibacillus hisashii TaxID=996558 RepID=UPI0022B97070
IWHHLRHAEPDAVNRAQFARRPDQGAGSAYVADQRARQIDNQRPRIQWVQPLDFLTKHIGVTGFGFNANATIVDQTSKGAAIAYG